MKNEGVLGNKKSINTKHVLLKNLEILNSFYFPSQLLSNMHFAYKLQTIFFWDLEYIHTQPCYQGNRYNFFLNIDFKYIY